MENDSGTDCATGIRTRLANTAASTTTTTTTATTGRRDRFLGARRGAA